MTKTVPKKVDIFRPALLISAIVLIVIWGSAFTMVSVAVIYMSPLWLVAYRLLLSALVVSGFALLIGQRFPKLSDPRWLWYFLLGQTGMVLPFFLTSKAQTIIDSGLSAILVGTMPLMTIVLAHYFAHENLSLRKTLGFVLGFLGTIILFIPEQLGWSLVSDWRAQMLSIIAALCYAVTTVAAKRAPQTPSAIAAAMMLIGALIIAVPAAMVLNGAPPLIASTGLWMVIGLGLGSSGLATILYLYVIEQSGPTMMAKINYFPPFVSVLAGIVFLSEDFTKKTAFAFVLIMLGVWIARQRKPKLGRLFKA